MKPKPNRREVKAPPYPVEHQLDWYSALPSSEAAVAPDRQKVQTESGYLETSEAILRLQPDGRIRSWNPGAETIFGCAAQDAIGRHVSEIVTDDDGRFVLATTKLEPGSTTMGVVTRLGRAERSIISYRLFGESGPTGELTDISAYLRDVTEIIKANDAHKQHETLKEIVDHQEQYRRRIARDLHDHIGQQVTGLNLALTNLRAQLGTESREVAKLEDLQQQVEQLDRDITFLAFELRPHVLQTMDVVDAIENFAGHWGENYGVEVQFHGNRATDASLTNEIQTNLYRIAQEALNNVAKHARASSVSIIIDVGPERLCLIIEDNGVGIKQAEPNKMPDSSAGHGAGLGGMKERAALIGCVLEIESTPGAGTTIFVRAMSRFLDPK